MTERYTLNEISAHSICAEHAYELVDIRTGEKVCKFICSEKDAHKLDQIVNERYVKAERAGRLGGRVGGTATSRAKRKAVRENGKKGGRPRQVMSE